MECLDAVFSSVWPTHNAYFSPVAMYHVPLQIIMQECVLYMATYPVVPLQLIMQGCMLYVTTYPVPLQLII